MKAGEELEKKKMNSFKQERGLGTEIPDTVGTERSLNKARFATTSATLTRVDTPA